MFARATVFLVLLISFSVAPIPGVEAEPSISTWTVPRPTSGVDMWAGSHCLFMTGSSVVVLPRTSPGDGATLSGVIAESSLLVGDDLFVVPPSNDRVERYRFGPSCLAPTLTTYLAPDDTLVSELAWTGGRIWTLAQFNDPNSGQQHPAFVRINPATSAVTRFILADEQRVGWITTSVGAPGKLFSDIGSFDVSGVAPVVETTGYAGFLWSSRLVMSGAASNIVGIDISDQPYSLRSVDADTYDASAPAWLELGSERSLFALAAHPQSGQYAGLTHGEYEPPAGPGFDQLTFWDGSGQQLFSQAVVSAAGYVLDLHALAYTPDGDHIYALSYAGKDLSQGYLSLIPTNLEDSGVTIHAPNYARYGRPIRVSVRLEPRGGSVELYAKEAGRSKRLIASGATADDGALVVDYPASRNVTFSVVYEGDDSHLSDSASTRTEVYPVVKGRLLRAYATRGGVKLYRRTVTPVFAAAFIPDAKTTVTFTLRNERGRRVATGYAGSNRNGVAAIAIATLRPGVTYTVEAEVTLPGMGTGYSKRYAFRFT